MHRNINRTLLAASLVTLLLALPALQPAATQTILTADQFFRQLSENYAAIRDYEATVTVDSSRSTMTGTIIYKSPSLMRLDFTQPARQVAIYNGTELLIYVPEFNAVLRQVTSTSGASASAIATSEGLRMLSRSYTITYVTGPVPEPLDAGSSERVINLVLTRRSVADGFRTINLSIDPERLLIRRMRGVTLSNEVITLNFTNIKTNVGLSDVRFIYEYPSSANSYNNFLFNSGN
jgi:outer membrane lipoprotein-sorting protein